MFWYAEIERDYRSRVTRNCVTESGFRNMECSDQVRTAVAFPNVGLGSLLHPVPWVSVD